MESARAIHFDRFIFVGSVLSLSRSLSLFATKVWKSTLSFSLQRNLILSYLILISASTDINLKSSNSLSQSTSQGDLILSMIALFHSCLAFLYNSFTIKSAQFCFLRSRHTWYILSLFISIHLFLISCVIYPLTE